MKAGQANLDIQPAFNEYKAVTHMCQYFYKTEDQCSQAMKQAAKEAYENNIHHHDTMKIIAKAYLNSRECSVQEAVYYILPELKLTRIFPSAYFVNANLPEERVQTKLKKKELSELPDDNLNIFKKSNIDCYAEIPSATLMMMMMMMMMIMMMMNCFCGRVDQRKALNFISSREHCQRFSSLQISDTL